MTVRELLRRRRRWPHRDGCPTRTRSALVARPRAPAGKRAVGASDERSTTNRSSVSRLGRRTPPASRRTTWSVPVLGPWLRGHPEGVILAPTELVVELAAAPCLRTPRSRRGTGRVPIVTLALELCTPAYRHRFPAAIAIARANATRLGGRVHFVLDDLASSAAGFDLVVPTSCVPEAEVAGLAPSLPGAAWRAPGADGTELLRRLVCGVRAC